MTREHQVEHQRDRVAGEEAADVLQLAHAGDRVADAARLEVRERQAHQVAEQARAEFDVDAAGGVAEDVGAQRGEHALEDDHDEQADDEHVECGQAVMHQHLVHHDLEEQRAHQREELQEQRDDQHFAEQLAVLDQAGDEPAEVEFGNLAGQAGAAGDQDQVAGPLRGKHAERLGSSSGRLARRRTGLATARAGHRNGQARRCVRCLSRRAKPPGLAAGTVPAGRQWFGSAWL